VCKETNLALLPDEIVVLDSTVEADKKEQSLEFSFSSQPTATKNASSASETTRTTPHTHEQVRTRESATSSPAVPVSTTEQTSVGVVRVSESMQSKRSFVDTAIAVLLALLSYIVYLKLSRFKV
jgi:hypothetical protein